MTNTETASPVLRIVHLSKSLGQRKVLNNVHLDVYPGEIVGFLGPNGAGKTTTIKLMLGLLKITDGEIEICGHNVVTDFEKALECVGSIIENPEMYKYLSGRENLEVYRRMYRDIPKSRIDEVAAMVHLSERINDKVGKYSLGMRQRLGAAQALLNDPKLLVLDEPTNGLDPVGIKELRETLTELAHEHGTAVFISSHQLAELDMICDRVCIIDRGNVIGIKTIEEIRNAGNGDREVTRICVLDPDKAKEVLTGQAATFTSDANSVTVSTDFGGTPAIIKALAAADVGIMSATPVKHSIEEAYIEATTPFGEEAGK